MLEARLHWRGAWDTIETAFLKAGRQRPTAAA